MSPKTPSQKSDPRLPKTILYVEDEYILREVLERRLKKEGYHVHTFQSGLEAARAIEDGLYYDLLLLDLSLADFSGDELARISKLQHPHTPTISLTGYLRMASQAPVDVYLEKPVLAREIISAIESNLNR